MTRWNSINFQDTSSFNIIELVTLHDYIIVIMSRILILIVYLLVFIYTSTKTYKTFSERTIVETIWSVIPALILILLVIPSIKVLYMVEDFKNPIITLKITAHQWYWTTLNPLFINLFFKNNRNLLTHYEIDSLIKNKTPRLLQSTSKVLLPANISSRILISSTDVIHSFSIPRLGLKVDALPGRINQLYSIPFRMGIYFGQCSEICGSNHSFIPIKIQVCSIKQYNNYTILKSLENITI